MKKPFIFIGLLLTLLLQVPQTLYASFQNDHYLGLHEARFNMNVRSQPKVGNNLIDNIKKGKSVLVKKVLGQWCEVHYKRYQKAYVYCSLLQVQQNSSTDAPKAKTYNDAIVQIQNNMVNQMGIVLGNLEPNDETKWLEAFKKIRLIVMASHSQFNAVEVPRGLERLAIEMKNLFEAQKNDIDQVISMWEVLGPDKGYEDFIPALIDFKATEDAATVNFNKIQSEIAAFYGQKLELLKK